MSVLIAIKKIIEKDSHIDNPIGGKLVVEKNYDVETEIICTGDIKAIRKWHKNSHMKTFIVGDVVAIYLQKSSSNDKTNFVLVNESLRDISSRLKPILLDVQEEE